MCPQPERDCPLTVSVGSTYSLPGAGWHMTSIFSVLVVRPTTSRAEESLPTLCCNLRLRAESEQEVAYSALPYLVLAWSLLDLKSLPSVLAS